MPGTLGTLFVVATPIGNLEDITVRALRVLRDVSLIAAEDTRRTAHLLARHGIATPMTSLHEHNEGKKSGSLIARLAQGESVALVSDAGTPTVSDPGSLLIRESIAAGIRVEPIPGASAVLAALAASGLQSETFAFFGFPPTRAKARRLWFERLARAETTAIFFEAPHRIQSTLCQLMESIGDRQIVVGRELTKVHEQLVRGHISEVLKALPVAKGEFTVVVDIGQSTESDEGFVIGSIESRRQAIASLAKIIGVSPNQLYEAVEQFRKSGS